MYPHTFGRTEYSKVFPDQYLHNFSSRMDYVRVLVKPINYDKVVLNMLSLPKVRLSPPCAGIDVE